MLRLTFYFKFKAFHCHLAKTRKLCFTGR